ncbi:unnamed protein product [Cochlearia groenlandica]
MASSDLYIFDMSSSSLSSSIYTKTTTTTTDMFCNNQLYSFDHFTPHILSSSPPSDLLGTLTFSDSQISDAVKSERFFSYVGDGGLTARSYGAIENSGRYMQRSFSSNSVDGKPNQVPFNIPVMKSPESDLFHGQMRRGYSTGDLQSVSKNLVEQRSSENSSEKFSGEQRYKVGRYSAEERKEKISKYRAKRNHRNFTKTIKYACRKTLADSRHRIRGRFARNDEIVEIPTFDDNDLIWKMDGLHEEDEAFMVQHSSFSSFW